MRAASITGSLIEKEVGISRSAIEALLNNESLSIT